MIVAVSVRTLLAALALAPSSAHRASGAPDTNTTRFETDGIPVILRRVTSNDVVSANVYLLGGVRQVTDATTGIEP